MKKELHVATNFHELQKLAKVDLKTFSTTNNTLYKSAEKLFNNGIGKMLEGDEETAYIYFLRFQIIYEHLEKSRNDHGYTSKRLGRELNTVNKHFSYLEQNLNNRYKNEKKPVELQPVISDEPVPVEKNALIDQFPSGYITCCELFNLFKQNRDIVIFDTRQSKDFNESSMMKSCCVNIPEEIIDSGLSANKLGKEIPIESKSQWDRRWKSSLTILLDWSSTKETIMASKLSILKDILMNWDTTMEEDSPPVVLNGGYLDWLQQYPMYCTNPHIVHNIQNSVLNDLLDLDSIEYPSTEEQATSSRVITELPSFDRSTKPIVTDGLIALRKNLRNKEIELAQKEKDFQDNHDAYLLEKEKQLENLDIQIELHNQEEKLRDDQAAIDKNRIELNVENEKLNKEIESMKIKDTANDKQIATTPNDPTVRQRLLQEARENKKKYHSIDTHMFPPDNQKFLQRDNFPNFDRSRKPNLILQTLPGMTGLFNFGNTCYMNSIVQCLAHTRTIYMYFIDTQFRDNRDSESNGNNQISQAFAETLRYLWNGERRSFHPEALRESVKRSSQNYKYDLQQDAHEFMLSLTNWLHDENKQDISRPVQVVWTPRQKSWIEQTDGKYSVISATFGGQIQYTITCDRCNKLKNRYEVFENLSLELPQQNSCFLLDCLTSYFGTQEIKGYKCPQCKNEDGIHQQTAPVAFPPVLVLLLKRFCENEIPGKYVKNDTKVNFPPLFQLASSPLYYLYAVIVHSGVMESGHYFSYVRHLKNDNWYLFNDDTVTQVEESDVLSHQKAYILFYRSEEEERKSRIGK